MYIVVYAKRRIDAANNWIKIEKFNCLNDAKYFAQQQFCAGVYGAGTLVHWHEGNVK